MNEKDSYLLNLLGENHFNELTLFYTRFFDNYCSCIDFLFSVLRYEPIICKIDNNFFCLDSENNIIADDVFIPKRMLNAVMRFVSVARDIETIRPRDDPFKVIFLITCIESLQTQRGKKFKSKSEKKEMIFDFFESFTSPDDSQYIHNHFENIPDDFFEMSKSGPTVLAEALYSIRNAAVHTGDCWGSIFPEKNSGEIITVPGRNKTTMHRAYTNAIPYTQFEQIFVRTCINLIRNYVAQKYEL